MILLRLRRLMERNFIQRSELVRRTGIRGGTISDLMDNQCKMLSMDVIETICQELHAQPQDWIVFLPKKFELECWQKFAEEWTHSKVMTIPGSDQYDIDLTLYEDFRRACSVVTEPIYVDGVTYWDVPEDLYTTGRPRKKIRLEELLEEHGLRLDRHAEHVKVVPAQDYFQKYETAEEHPGDSPYYRSLREILVEVVPSFHDTLELKTKKREKLWRFWMLHTEMSVDADERHMLPEELRRFLLRVEANRERVAVKKKNADGANPLQNGVGGAGSISPEINDLQKR